MHRFPKPIDLLRHDTFSDIGCVVLITELSETTDCAEQMGGLAESWTWRPADIRECRNRRGIVGFNGGLELGLGDIGDADGGHLLVARHAGALADIAASKRAKSGTAPIFSVREVSSVAPVELLQQLASVNATAALSEDRPGQAGQGPRLFGR